MSKKYNTTHCTSYYPLLWKNTTQVLTDMSIPPFQEFMYDNLGGPVVVVKEEKPPKYNSINRGLYIDTKLFMPKEEESYSLKAKE